MGMLMLREGFLYLFPNCVFQEEVAKATKKTILDWESNDAKRSESIPLFPSPQADKRYYIRTDSVLEYRMLGAKNWITSILWNKTETVEFIVCIMHYIFCFVEIKFRFIYLIEFCMQRNGVKALEFDWLKDWNQFGFSSFH